MNVETYLERRRLLNLNEPKLRTLCITCFQPDFGCYCKSVRRFDPQIEFVILIHPVEVKRRIATGRMSHLTLAGSRLIMGQEFGANPEVNRIIGSPDRHAVILYPGPNSVDLSPLTTPLRARLFPRDKKLSVFVIDGTWATARKMVRSPNLLGLPRVCFSPTTPSRFRVRKQPQVGCYSTIEAIHQMIELLGDSRGFDVAARTHDSLLDVFDSMVEKQLQCVRTIRSNRQLTYRREGSL